MVVSFLMQPIMLSIKTSISVWQALERRAASLQSELDAAVVAAREARQQVHASEEERRKLQQRVETAEKDMESTSGGMHDLSDLLMINLKHPE